MFSYYEQKISKERLTNMISSSSAFGDLLIMECMVLRSVVQASLWNTMTMLVVGSLTG